MKLIDTQIEINEDFIPNSNITYDIYYDGKLNFEARLSDKNTGKVSIEDAPYVLNYVMNKPLSEFTDDEKEQILAYRGLTLKDGFEAMDVFMEKSYTKLVLTIKKDRFLDWYYNYGQDQENEELRLDLVKSIIDQMYKVGYGSMSVQEVFDNCNQESIRAYFTQEFAYKTDEYDVELSNLGFEYVIILIN